MKSILKNVLLVAVTSVLLSFDLPKGWRKAGSDPDKYEMGVDKGSGHHGKHAATIRSIDNRIKGFGTLMQNCAPGRFAGKRVRLTGMLRSKDVESYAGLWLRVDGAEAQNPLSFDNMYDRPVKGTTEWKSYAIVLDVPHHATNVAYGVLLHGTGQVWFDALTFEIVDDTVPTTGMSAEPVKMPATPQAPENLSFED